MSHVYVFTVGNTETRKGHRNDCAQIEVLIRIVADDETRARELLVAGEGIVVSYAIGSEKALSTAPCEALS